ncbi:hypothetical protein [Oceanobacillus salinisoli]|uniref:hypothetical protein n=1 Tax=Oceanobacillus salinisoli TaxID=2678611 RepID=UPI0012E14D9A|nr:hypothetical protein [Oceanobacillus salinisoli]
MQFIPAEESPTKKAMLAATHEVSGTVAVYEFNGKDITGPVKEQNDNQSFNKNR